MSTAHPTQLEIANELLRAALEIITKTGWTAYRQTTVANGGGDGLCVVEEIKDYFEGFDVPAAPQFPDETVQP